MKNTALSVSPTAHITLHRSPEVKVGHSCARRDKSHVAQSQHFLSSHTGAGGTEFLSPCPMAKPERSRWLADSTPTVQALRHEVLSRISSQSWLTPMGAWFMLVQQRIARQATKYPARTVTPSFLLTPGATHNASPADCRVCVIGRVGAVRALRPGRRDSHGETANPVSAEV